MKNMKKRIPAIALIAAVCVTGLIAASASSFADMIGDKDAKDVTGEHTNKITSTNQYIGEDAAKKIVIAKVTGSAIGDITEFYLEHDDGKAEYDGKMYFKNVKYEFEINAVDGTVLEWEQSNKKTTSPGAVDTNTSATGTVTPSSNGTVDTTSSATGTVTPGGNGTVDTSTYIGIEKVKSIVLLKAPGATIEQIELEYDDGKAKYEGKLYLNNLEYEFEINAVTGAVLDWESDAKDDSDNDSDDHDSDDDSDDNGSDD